MNPYVFIVGCPRSGTTLLRRIVNAHPEIAITSESPWIIECLREQCGLTPRHVVTPELISRLLQNPRFGHLHLGQNKLMALLRDGAPVSYASFVSGVFDLCGRRYRKALVGNKTPFFVRAIDTLHALWPGARFVHLIRDGRDVCLSVVNWPKAAQADKPGSFATWAEDPVSTTGL
jgi:sulfotransferase family protein